MLTNYEVALRHFSINIEMPVGKILEVVAKAASWIDKNEYIDDHSGWTIGEDLAEGIETIKSNIPKDSWEFESAIASIHRALANARENYATQKDEEEERAFDNSPYNC